MDQEWIKELERENRVIIHSPLSKEEKCRICMEKFEKEVIEDFTIYEEYKNYTPEEWSKRIDATDDYCPLCGRTFDYIYNCIVCGKRYKTNWEIKGTGGIKKTLCSQGCSGLFHIYYKYWHCPVCKCSRATVISLSEDYTLDQIFEENTAYYWEDEIEEADTFCPLCGVEYKL